MEYYDVIIIGAGIAGCGLAYNLSRIGYKGSVLVIDKEGVGANKGHNTRTIFQDVVQEYDLPSSYLHKYKGIKVGFDNKTFITINENIYHTYHDKICQYFLKHSDAVFKKENSVGIKNKILITNKNRYKFNYLIDCSGKNFFLRELFNKPLPLRYWMGNLKILENKNRINNNYVFYNYSDYGGYVEEINPLKNKITHGYWQYTKKINFNDIRIPEKTMYKTYLFDAKVIKRSQGIIVGSPSKPLIFKNYAFLGDSFGSASSSTAYGVSPTLDSSKMLAESIFKNNLYFYDKKWREKYIETYIRYLAFKTITYKINELIKKFKGYSPLSKILKEYLINDCGKDFFKMLKYSSYRIKIPKKIRKNLPIYCPLIQLIYYNYLKCKYK